MSEPSETGGRGGTGRSRGRARGRAVPLDPQIEDSLAAMQGMRLSPEGDNGGSNGSNGNGNGGNGNGNGNGDNGAAVRGRGGYRKTVEPELDTRPKDMTDFAGDIGEEILLFSNYFRLRTPTKVIMSNFHVKFEPDVEAIGFRKKLVYGIPDLFDQPFVFDDTANIKSMTTDRRERERIVKDSRDNSDIKINIRFTEEVPWGSTEMFRFYNTQMRKNLQYIGWVLMGRNYYDVKSKQELPEYKITLMPGAITAIGQHDDGILMVIDSSTKFVRSDNVLQVMHQIRQQRRDDWLEEAKRQLGGAIVMTEYNNRTYKIDDLVTDKTPDNHEFERKGVKMTIRQYYKQTHNIDIRVGTQPLIECLPSKRDQRAGRTDKLLLVPELCKMTGLTDQMRSDHNMMRRIGDVSRLKPPERVANLKKFMTTVTTNPQVIEDMRKWNLSFDPNLVEVKGRLLPCERIYMGRDDDNSALLFQQKTGDFSKEMRSKKLFETISINKWILICSQRDEHHIQDFLETLRRVAQPMAIQLGNPRRQVLTDDRTGTFVGACQALGTPCEMAVIIVPNNNKDRYDAIKKVMYCENPMASQVVVSRTLNKKQMLMSVCTKIIIQMATKLGAQPWALKIPPKNVMVCGYDTYHDSSIKGRSVGGFVCSMNQSLTSWFSRASYHEKQEEMSANFSNNLREGMKKYFEVNHTLPLRVIVYRDGVGDGMIPHVFTFELKQIQTVLESFTQPEAEPIKLAFVIVTKRVNARFFTWNGKTHDNPIPGTLVDKTVTRSLRYDFYLISQSVRQGTVSPTMYNIIYDSTGLKPSHHQQLAYKLTHLYFNWQGTVSVPAPCQYAHKLAYLTGTSLHREPNPALSHRLFFL